MENKTHWRKAFNSEYIGSSDLDDYKDIILTIKEVKLEQLKGTKEKDTKNVAYFVEKIKPMILNATSCKTLRKFAGGSNYIEDWKGLRIIVYVEKGIKAFGDVTDALRIRPTQPPAQEKQVDVTEAILKLSGCISLEDLQSVYLALSKDERNHHSVVQVKEEMKAKLTPKQTE